MPIILEVLLVLRLKTHQEFVDEVKRLVGDEYIVIGQYTGVRNNVEMLHTVCNRIITPRPDNFIKRGKRCKWCSGKYKKTHNEFVDIVKKVLGEDYLVLSEYITANDRIRMKHLVCDREYTITPSEIISRHAKCRWCFGTKNVTHDEFVARVGALTDDYVVISKYINDKTKVWLKHKSCGHEFDMRPSNFVNHGQRCPNPDCKNKRIGDKLRKSHTDFVSQVYSMVGDEYTVLGTYRRSGDKVLMKHTKCGHEFHMFPFSFLNGNRCPRCRQSRGEKKVREFLGGLNLNFDEQYRFDDCRNVRPLRFDFAVFDNDILYCLIEFDGSQHFVATRRFGAEEKLQRNQHNDQIKNQYCTDHNIKLIRIPYTEFDRIEEILSDELIGIIHHNKTDIAI